MDGHLDSICCTRGEARTRVPITTAPDPLRGADAGVRPPLWLLSHLCSLVLNLCVIVCVFCLCLSYSEMLAFTLTAFLELMDHGIVSWDMVSITFIKQVRPPAFCLPLPPHWPLVLWVHGDMKVIPPCCWRSAF